jgi:hypothetical protein
MARFACLLALLVAAAPAMAQKVYVDWDREVDFSSYETYSWLPTEETSIQNTDQLMHNRLRNAIEMKMTEGVPALRLVDSDPDLYVTYHTDEREEMVLDTNTFGYGYGAGWGWDPFWGPGSMGGNVTTTARSYTRGTLIIDVYDPREKKAIWRGTAEAVVQPNPRKVEKQIVKAVNKIAKKWRKQYAEERDR